MPLLTIIGYGNPLRGDDGVGWLVANRIISNWAAYGFPNATAGTCSEDSSTMWGCVHRSLNGYATNAACDEDSLSEPRTKTGNLDDCSAEVMAVYQLTPELAEDLSVTNSVIFVDASCGIAPGIVSCRSLSLRANDPESFSVDCGLGENTHRFDPHGLLAFTRSVYGTVPRRSFFLTVGGESFDYKEGLSPAVAASVPVVEQILLAHIANSMTPQPPLIHAKTRQNTV